MSDSTDFLRKSFGWITLLYACVVSTIKPLEGLFAAGLLLLGFYIVWRGKQIDVQLRTYCSILFLHLAVNAVSLVSSGNQHDVGLFVLRNCTVFIGAVIALNLRDIRLLLSALAFFGLGVCILAGITVYEGLILGIREPRPPGFMTAVHAGYVLSYGLLVVIVCCLHLQRHYLLCGVVAGLLSVALVLNATRGAWIATVIALVPLIMQSKIRFWLSGFALVALVALFSLPQARTRTINDIQAVLHYSYGNPTETSLGAKLDMWLASYALFKRSPVLGIGPDQWYKSMQDMIDRKQASEVLRRFNQPHNMFVHALVTTGAVGMVIFTVLVGFPYYFLKRSRHQRSLFSDLLSVVTLSFIVQGLFDAVPVMYRPFHSYLFLVGICLAGTTWTKHDGSLFSAVFPKNRCES